MCFQLRPSSSEREAGSRQMLMSAFFLCLEGLSRQQLMLGIVPVAVIKIINFFNEVLTTVSQGTAPELSMCFCRIRKI